MNLSRREFFSHTKEGMLALALSQWLPGILFKNLQAAPVKLSRQEGHFFVMLRTFGGMDVTLGLDPQVLAADADIQDLFLEYRPEDIIKAEGLKLGPAAASLAAYAKDCLVINGVMMRRDAGHDAINLYMATGRGDGKAASIPVELALSTGSGPFGLVMNGQVYLAGKAATLTSSQDLLSGSDEAKLLALVEEKLKWFAISQGTPFEEAQKKMIEGKSAAAKMAEALKNFQTSTPKLEEKHAVAAAFISGASEQAQLDITGANFLDTHSSHEKNHLKAQKAIWEKVTDIFKFFKSVPYSQGSLFDSTTFMVMSEWSRTPALNAAKGKDHNPYTNSVLLAGKSIQGGTVVGASRLNTRKITVTGSSDHIAWPFDYKTGKLAEKPEGASFIYPENVVRTIGQMFGDPEAFSPVAKTIPVIPGVVK
jgi:hypothetical protein